MIALHPSLDGIHMPEQIRHLPRDKRGFPVPWFVAFIDGEADFRGAIEGLPGRMHGRLDVMPVVLPPGWAVKADGSQESPDA